MYICGEKYCIMFNANKLFVYLTGAVILLLFVVVVFVVVWVLWGGTTKDTLLNAV